MTSKTEEFDVKMFNLLIEFYNDNNKRIDEYQILEIVTDVKKGAINALNDMFLFATHSICFFLFITKHVQKLQSLVLQDILMIQNLVY